METILIVDDDTLVLDLVENALSDQFAVLTATDGAFGLHLARQARPDLILTDIVMPRMDGYSLLLQLREDLATAHIPIVFMTGATQTDGLRHAMSLGADDFLTKPLKISDLRQSVRTQIEKQRTREQHTQQRLSQLRENISMALPHEMRTAIMVVQGYTNLLIEEKAPGTEEYEMLTVVRQNIDRLAQLSEKYLWYVRSNWGLSPLERDLTTEQIGDMVGMIAASVAEQVGRSMDLALNITEGHTTIQAPAEHLERIFIEVLENAFKFSEAGHTVTVRTQIQGRRYRVDVQDDGQGMSAEQVAAIGAFMQFGRRENEQQGTGLGMTIACQLAENLGGQLEIRGNSNGQGTWVMIRLPLAEQH